jgi:putative ABC transport system permease protein
LVGIVINGVLAGLVLVASLLLLLAAMIIAQTFYSRVAMRRREYGLYRALGAPRRLIYRLVLSEALIAGGVAGFLGVIVGFGAAYAIEMSTLAALPELPFELTAIALYHPGLILLGIGLALCFAFLGALGPAARAAAVDPAEALELS